MSNETDSDYLYYQKYQFIVSQPAIAVPCVLILAIAGIIGIMGNIFILIAVRKTKSLHSVESTFIVNLAISDLYVTSIADPMSIVAKLEGEDFYSTVPGLCQVIGSGCTVSCVVSLMTIAIMSFNRYVSVCYPVQYPKIFTKVTAKLFCVFAYVVAFSIVLVNLADIGDHGFDRKSLECIWDRMATYQYTVMFTIVFVWLPVLMIGLSYFSLYRKFVSSRAKVGAGNDKGVNASAFRLAKTLFVIYATFTTCWAPYALLIALDDKNEYPPLSHLIITIWAHLHPSINWFVYYMTHRMFFDAFNKLFGLNKVWCLSKLATFKENVSIVTENTGT